MQYPTPELPGAESSLLVVKNTFIDEQHWRPTKLIHSCPASAIGDVFRSDAPCTPTAAVPGHQTQAGPEARGMRCFAGISPSGKEQDISSRSGSTSAGSSSPESSDSETETTVLPLRMQSLDEGSLPAWALPTEDAGCTATSLPVFDVPSTLLVKNTFIHMCPVGRDLSLDGFFEEREIRSCPVSGIGALPGPDGNSEELAACGPGAAYEGLLAAAATAAAAARAVDAALPSQG